MLCFFGGFKSIWILSVGQCQRTLGGPTQSRRGPLFVEEPDYPISPRKKKRNIFFLNCIQYFNLCWWCSHYIWQGPKGKAGIPGVAGKPGLSGLPGVDVSAEKQHAACLVLSEWLNSMTQNHLFWYASFSTMSVTIAAEHAKWWNVSFLQGLTGPDGPPGKDGPAGEAVSLSCWPLIHCKDELSSVISAGCVRTEVWCPLALCQARFVNRAHPRGWNTFNEGSQPALFL